MAINISRSPAHSLEILLYDFRLLVFTVAEISRKLGYSQSKTYRLVPTAVNGAKGIILERVETEEPIRLTLFQPDSRVTKYDSKISAQTGFQSKQSIRHGKIEITP